MAKNLRNLEKVKTGWMIPTEVKESFINFCAEKGSVAQEDVAGALLIWQYLPAQIREEAKLESKGVRAIDKKFWQQFCHGLELGIEAQSRTRPRKPGRAK